MVERNRSADSLLIELKDLLRRILLEKGSKKAKLVYLLEDKINAYAEITDSKISEILSDILMDLSLYQSNPIIRWMSGGGLLNDKQLDSIIATTLREVESFGLA